LNGILRIGKSLFVKNILMVMSGTAAAQVISFALSPVISRLYSPSDFGVYGSFDAVLSVLAAGVTLDYAQAIMLPRDNKDANNLFALSCLSTAVISVGCLAVWLLAPSLLMGLLKAPRSWMPLLLVAAVVISGINTSCQAWCVRAKAFKDTAASQIVRSLSSNGMQVGLSYLGGGPSSLIGGVIVGDALASVNLARVVLGQLRTRWKEISWKRIRELAGEYRDFPLYSSTQNVMNALSQGLPVLLLTHFYGIAVAGAYAFAVRIVNVPMRFVLAPLRQVLFQKAAEAQNDGDRLFPLYAKVTLGLFSLCLIPCTAAIIWSPQIFSWVFGSQWYTAGEYGRSLVLWLAVAFCNLPAVLFAKIIRIQRFNFLYDLSLLIMRAATLALGGLYLNATQTVMLFSLVGAAMNAVLILRVGLAVKKRDAHA
jgi:lipopolysaccharide exporter